MTVSPGIAAAAFGSFKPEDRFDPVSARARHIARRSPMGIRPETSRMGSADMRCQLSKNCIQAIDRPDAPSQGQYIAPMAIRMKQRLEQNVVGFRKSLLELRKPIVRNRRDGFCSNHHSCAHVIDLRTVSRLYNLPSLPHLPGRTRSSPLSIPPNMIA